MRFTTASVAAILLVAGAAAPAFGKGHLAPEGDHVFGQERADESYIVGGETAKLDAKGTTDSEKGLSDPSVIMKVLEETDREPAGGNTPE